MKRSLVLLTFAAAWTLVQLSLAVPAWPASPGAISPDTTTPHAADEFDKGMSFYEAGNFEEAAKFIAQAAEQGNADAQHILGVMHQTGRGMPQDNAGAVEWYRKAALQGQVIAQLNLGVMYDQGQGIPRDHAQAAKWFRMAAQQGNADAQFNLGLMHKLGRGVPQDYAQAVKWFQKAAKQGQVIAQLNLGVLYANGEGISQDYVLAHMWSDLAAGNGQDGGGMNRELIANEMTPRQIAKAQLLAREWKAIKE